MKNAIITGASGGIGLAITKKFLENGYRVFALTCSNPDKPAGLDITADERSRLFIYQADASAPDEYEAVLKKIAADAGELDCLVNNLGISHFSLLQDETVESYRRVMDVNFASYFIAAKAVIPLMLARKNGAIVNISSVWGECGASCEVLYSASKGAVNSFTKALAKELAPSGIRVNAIAPGVIDTPMNSHLSADEAEELKGEIGLGRFGAPEEVAETALFLASGRSSYITGEIINVNGIFG